MAVSPGPNKVAYFQAGLLGKHVGQERIRGDIEGNTKEHVGTALIQL